MMHHRPLSLANGQFGQARNLPARALALAEQPLDDELEFQEKPRERKMDKWLLLPPSNS